MNLNNFECLVCPKCGFEYNHFMNFSVYNNKSGNCYKHTLKGECGCVWTLEFKSHKGTIESYVEILEPCCRESSNENT